MTDNGNDPIAERGRHLILDDDDVAPLPEGSESRPVTLGDDDRVSLPEEIQARGANVAIIGDNVATEGTTGKWGAETEGVRIGGAMGWAKGDIIGRFDPATGYDENAKLGTASGTGAETAETARHLVERAMAESKGWPEPRPWEYRLDPAYRLDSDGKMRPVEGQHHIAFSPENLVVSRSTVTDRYGIAQPADVDRAMTTITRAVGEHFGADIGISRTMLWADRSQYVVQSQPLPAGIIPLPSGGNGGGLELRLMGIGGFDGGKGLTLLCDGRVPACRNVMQSIMRGANLRWSFKHIGDVAGKLAIFAEMLALQLTERLPGLAESIALQGKRTLTDRQLAQALAKVLGQVDDDGQVTFSNKAKSAGRRLVHAYRNGPGAQPGTVWGAEMMASYFATHEHAGAKRFTREERVYTAAASRFDAKMSAAIDATLAVDSGQASQAERDTGLVYQQVRDFGVFA